MVEEKNLEGLSPVFIPSWPQSTLPSVIRSLPKQPCEVGVGIIACKMHIPFRDTNSLGLCLDVTNFPLFSVSLSHGWWLHPYEANTLY